MMTDTQANIYLTDRAGRHGMTLDDLMSMTPENVADCPQEAMTFWEQRDISHILPQSDYPWFASDPTNMMPEDPSVNRSRGADVMTDREVFIADQDNQMLADIIDTGSHDYFFFGLA